MTWTSDIAISTGWLLVPLLLAVILYDLRFMRLPNALSLLMVALFMATAPWVLPLDALVWRVCAGGLVLLIGMAANAARLLGGGDVKVLAALVLFVPTQALLEFAFVLCISMIVGIVSLLALRKILRATEVSWIGLQENGRYPMGLSIGMAGLFMVVAGG